MYKSENKRKYYGTSSYSRSHGKIWDVFEDEIVVEKLMPDADLARLLGRSVASIQCRRRYLRKREAEGLR